MFGKHIDFPTPPRKRNLGLDMYGDDKPSTKRQQSNKLATSSSESMRPTLSSTLDESTVVSPQTHDMGVPALEAAVAESSSSAQSSPSNVADFPSTRASVASSTLMTPDDSSSLRIGDSASSDSAFSSSGSTKSFPGSSDKVDTQKSTVDSGSASTSSSSSPQVGRPFLQGPNQPPSLRDGRENFGVGVVEGKIFDEQAVDEEGLDEADPTEEDLSAETVDADDIRDANRPNSISNEQAMGPGRIFKVWLDTHITPEEDNAQAKAADGYYAMPAGPPLSRKRRYALSVAKRHDGSVTALSLTSRRGHGLRGIRNPDTLRKYIGFIGAHLGEDDPSRRPQDSRPPLRLRPGAQPRVVHQDSLVYLDPTTVKITEKVQATSTWIDYESWRYIFNLSREIAFPTIPSPGPSLTARENRNGDYHISRLRSPTRADQLRGDSYRPMNEDRLRSRSPAHHHRGRDREAPASNPSWEVSRSDYEARLQNSPDTRRGYCRPEMWEAGPAHRGRGRKREQGRRPDQRSIHPHEWSEVNQEPLGGRAHRRRGDQTQDRQGRESLAMATNDAAASQDLAQRTVAYSNRPMPANSDRAGSRAVNAGNGDGNQQSTNGRTGRRQRPGNDIYNAGPGQVPSMVSSSGTGGMESRQRGETTQPVNETARQVPIGSVATARTPSAMTELANTVDTTDLNKAN